MIEVAGNPSAVKLPAPVTIVICPEVISRIRLLSRVDRVDQSAVGSTAGPLNRSRCRGNPLVLGIVAASGNRGHLASLVDHAHAIVAAIGHEETSRRIGGDAGRACRREFRSPPGRRRTDWRQPRCRRRPRGIQFAYAIVGAVRKSTTHPFHRLTVRFFHGGNLSPIAISVVAAKSRAHDGLNIPVLPLIIFSDAVVTVRSANMIYSLLHPPPVPTARRATPVTRLAIADRSAKGSTTPVSGLGQKFGYGGEAAWRLPLPVGRLHRLAESLSPISRLVRSRPATVVMRPCEFTLRMRLLPVSAIRSCRPDRTPLLRLR